MYQLTFLNLVFVCNNLIGCYHGHLLKARSNASLAVKVTFGRDGVVLVNGNSLQTKNKQVKDKLHAKKRNIMCKQASIFTHAPVQW